MNFYGAKELAASFRTVRKNTLAIAEDIGEEHYQFSITPDTRTVAQTLIHIATISSLAERLHRDEQVTTLVGLDFTTVVGPLIAEEKVSRTKAAIIEMLRERGERFATWLEGLSDEFLAEQVTMPTGSTPSTKSRFEMLLGVKEHEMHHRGQLMMMERLVGVVPHLTREFQARMAARASTK